MIPGSTLVNGSQCDDCVVSVSLPFSYNFYDRSFSGGSVAANGQLVFSTPADPQYSNYCLPDFYSNYAIMPHWSDLTMLAGYEGCTYYPSGCGIFTSVTGTTGNRIFAVEWRALSFSQQLPINFEILLYENQPKIRLDLCQCPAGLYRSGDHRYAKRSGQPEYQYLLPGQPQSPVERYEVHCCLWAFVPHGDPYGCSNRDRYSNRYADIHTFNYAYKRSHEYAHKYPYKHVHEYAHEYTYKHADNCSHEYAHKYANLHTHTHQHPYLHADHHCCSFLHCYHPAHKYGHGDGYHSSRTCDGCRACHAPE